MGCSVSREKVDFFEPDSPNSFVSIDLEDDIKTKKNNIVHNDSLIIFEKKLKYNCKK
jgi:hypothetical protein